MVKYVYGSSVDIDDISANALVCKPTCITDNNYCYFQQESNTFA